MATGTLLSVQDYLNGIGYECESDVDYVDGVIEERNVGEWDHGSVQSAVSAYFSNRRKQWRLRSATETRVQVAPTRFRVPDVVIVLEPGPFTKVLRQPPFICVEVLSPEDRMVRVRKRIHDFLVFGVPHIWVIDPELRIGYTYAADGLHEAKDGILRTSNPEIFLSLAEVFESAGPPAESNS